MISLANRSNDSALYFAELPKSSAIVGYLPELGFYCACLAAYNNGLMHGNWIDLDLCSDVEDIKAAIDLVLKSSPEAGAEEYAAHDYSGLPGYLTDSEWPDLAALIEYKEARAHFTGSGELLRLEAFELLCEDRHATVSADDLDENFCGFYTSGAEYAQDLACDTGAINNSMKWPLDCIDWDEAFRALDMNTFRANGGLYVFNNF